MKRILSLVLVLSFIIAFAPAAFADKSSEGIQKDNGHLYSCSEAGCACNVILYEAEKEAQEHKALEDLRVWLINWRDDEGYRNDTIVAEVELPYLYADKMENQEFLDANEKLKEVLLDYFDEDKLAENLYRSAGFIHTQVECSFDYLKELSKAVSLEYRVMGADSADKIILICPALDDEMESLTVRVGDILVKLPEACHNQAFTLAMSIAEDSAEIQLLDESGAAIEGAEIVK